MPAKFLENISHTDDTIVNEVIQAIEKDNAPIIVPLDTSYAITTTHTTLFQNDLPKLLIGSTEQLKQHVKKFSATARKLIKNFWPGPLEILLKDKMGDKIFINMPSETVSSAILKKSVKGLRFSYCLDGEKPITSKEELIRKYENNTKLIIFTGNPKFNFPPSRIDLTLFPPQILTQGSIPSKLLEDYFKMKVLFICTGNTCRSPLALYIVKKMIAEKNLDSFIDADSCGTFGGEGMSISENSMTILKEMGIEKIRHSSKSVSYNLLKNSDQVFCMQKQHMDYIKSSFPALSTKIQLLDLDSAEIDDPAGSPLEVYRKCAGQIISSIEKRLNKLITEGEW